MTKFEYIKLLISEMGADEFINLLQKLYIETKDSDGWDCTAVLQQLNEDADNIRLTNLQNLRNMTMNDDTLISMFFAWSELHREGCPKGAYEISKCKNDIDCRKCYKLWGELPCDSIGKIPEFVDHEEKIDD